MTTFETAYQNIDGAGNGSDPAMMRQPLMRFGGGITATVNLSNPEGPSLDVMGSGVGGTGGITVVANPGVAGGTLLGNQGTALIPAGVYWVYAVVGAGTDGTTGTLYIRNTSVGDDPAGANLATVAGAGEATLRTRVAMTVAADTVCDFWLACNSASDSGLCSTIRIIPQ